MTDLRLLGFQFEPLITTKIETIVEAYLTAKFLINKPVVKYLDFEPSTEMINTTKADGFIAVLIRSVNFPDATFTEEQTGRNTFEIICYGFGDPILDSESDEWESTVKEAQNRAEIFTSLVFRAIMDRAEVVEKFQPEITAENKIDFTDKIPVSIQKFAPFGAVDTNRGVCVYTSTYSLRTQEDPPTEPLGEILAGFNQDTETYNPGDEPE